MARSENISRSRISYCVTGLALILALGLALAFVTGFLHVPTAYARGAAEIAVQDEALELAFTSAATDDPHRTLDPGQELHVGRCTARVQAKKSVSFAIYNGYPGYACTLKVQLANRSEQAMSLRDIQYMAPAGLSIHGPDKSGGVLLAAGQMLEQEFRLVVGPEAREAGEYRLAIQEIFTLVETPTSRHTNRSR